MQEEEKPKKEIVKKTWKECKIQTKTERGDKGKIKFIRGNNKIFKKNQKPKKKKNTKKKDERKGK